MKGDDAQRSSGTGTSGCRHWPEWQTSQFGRHRAGRPEGSCPGSVEKKDSDPERTHVANLQSQTLKHPASPSIQNKASQICLGLRRYPAPKGKSRLPSDLKLPGLERSRKTLPTMRREIKQCKASRLERRKTAFICRHDHLQRKSDGFYKRANK